MHCARLLPCTLRPASIYAGSCFYVRCTTEVLDRARHCSSEQSRRIPAIQAVLHYSRIVRSISACERRLGSLQYCQQGDLSADHCPKLQQSTACRVSTALALAEADASDMNPAPELCSDRRSGKGRAACSMLRDRRHSLPSPSAGGRLRSKPAERKTAPRLALPANQHRYVHTDRSHCAKLQPVYFPRCATHAAPPRRRSICITHEPLVPPQPSSDGKDDLAAEIECLRAENARIKQKLASAASTLRQSGVAGSDVDRLTRSGAAAAWQMPIELCTQGALETSASLRIAATPASPHHFSNHSARRRRNRPGVCAAPAGARSCPRQRQQRKYCACQQPSRCSPCCGSGGRRRHHIVAGASGVPAASWHAHRQHGGPRQQRGHHAGGRISRCGRAGGGAAPAAASAAG